MNKYLWIMKFSPSSLLLLLQSTAASSAGRCSPAAAAAAAAAFHGSPHRCASSAFRPVSSSSSFVVPSRRTGAGILSLSLVKNAARGGGSSYRSSRSSSFWGRGSSSWSSAAAATMAAALSVSAGGGTAIMASSTASCDDAEEAKETSTFPSPLPKEALKHDTYNGVTIDVSKLPADVTDCADSFAGALRASLEGWKKEGRRGIWIRMTTSHSRLIPSITDLGFDFQHAEPGKVTLTKWLPSEEESRLPRGPTHQIGVGTLVLHPRSGKMLAVQEKTGPAAARKLWKMPTGLTDPGEDIADAAVRELKEETGLDCVFDKIICFRQAHSGGHLSHSDMFFVCLLRLHPKYEESLRKGEDVPLVPQEEEIAQADWIDMESYANQDVWQASPLYKEMNGAMIDAARGGIEYHNISEVAGSDDDTGGSTAVEPAVRANGHAAALPPTSALNSKVGGGFIARTLPVGFRPGTNTIYISKSQY